MNVLNSVAHVLLALGASPAVLGTSGSLLDPRRHDLTELLRLARVDEIAQPQHSRRTKDLGDA